MSKVLFTHSYFYKLDPKQWKFQQPYPPLGTLQAAAVARQAGFNVSFFDNGLADGPEEVAAKCESDRPDYFVLYDDGFNYLTKMCLSVMRDAAFVMAGHAKKFGCTVIISSSDSTDHYEKYLEHGADFIIRGEGEETLTELLKSLQASSDPAAIHGLAFRRGNKTIITSPRQVLRDLDALPLPAWDLLDASRYASIWRDRYGYFSLNIATTRGCPYKCNWCAKPIYGNRYHSRSPEQVVNEIEKLIRNYQPDHFWMCDDIFGLKPGWIREFATYIKQKNLSLRYKIQSRVDLLLEENTVQLLAESGCETVWVGAESGSQRILDAMDKGTTVGQIRKATKLLKAHHVNVAFFLQFGYPGETREDIDATIALVLELMPDEIGISVSYPLPGTKFYDTVKSQLSEKQNWTDSDDLAMLYRNTYPVAYYKILQRYVHSRYRIQRGVNRLRDFVREPTLRGGDFRKIVSMMYNVPVSMLHAYRLRQLSSAHAR
jgi:anaerobic magnesium-protoporphyrin IX monomethyl ester cyclase